MVGSWCLTTPMPDMWVMVNPAVVGNDHAFQVVVTREVENRLRPLEDAYWDEVYDRSEGTEGGEKYLAALAPYTRALRGFFLDLLRPVWVRDCPMNVEGRLSESDPLCGWRDGDGERSSRSVHGVDYSTNSTYALPDGVLANTKALDRLLAAAWKLNPGDYTAALTTAAEMLETASPAMDSEPGADEDEGHAP
jgi:hypothetical protein